MASVATVTHEAKLRKETANRLARRALFSFIGTFAISRVMVLLIMAGQVPNFYFFLKGTHVHHLNYGIFLLAAVCGYSVLGRPIGLASDVTAYLYGVAMGLTFDEFGMWLHLGGSYWQRTSIDSVIIVAACLGFVAFLPSLRQFERRHIRMSIAIVIFMAAFGAAVYVAGVRIGHEYGPALQALESESSP